jgi:hypothetical protein
MIPGLEIIKIMRQIKYTVFAIGFVFFAVSCGLVSSQAVNNSNNQNQNGSGKFVLKETPTPTSDIYEIAKAGAEKLNSETVERIKTDKKPLTRKQIREALTRSNLIGESKDGKLGGGKIVHFSHTCDLLVEGKLFRVIYTPVIVQLASFARRYNHTLIYDDSMRLVHDLTINDAPLFCDGNRLFFNDYEMNFSYGEPIREVKGNVLIFTNSAKDIEGRIANLNFYRFQDLIH